MNRVQAAQQMRRALQMLAMGLPTEKALEVATVYNPWKAGTTYSAGEYLTYGENSVGDPQLYKVVQPHTSQSDWTPHTAASLFKMVGLDEAGYPLWSQPVGAHDAYQMGDVVNYCGVLYQSKIDGNIYSPTEYAEVWTVYSEEA